MAVFSKSWRVPEGETMVFFFVVFLGKSGHADFAHFSSGGTLRRGKALFAKSWRVPEGETMAVFFQILAGSGGGNYGLFFGFLRQIWTRWFCALFFRQEGSGGGKPCFQNLGGFRRGKLWPFFPNLGGFRRGKLWPFFFVFVGKSGHAGFAHFSSGRRVPEGESLVFQILAGSGGGNYGRFFQILAGSGGGNYGRFFPNLGGFRRGKQWFFCVFLGKSGHAGFAHFSSGRRVPEGGKPCFPNLGGFRRGKLWHFFGFFGQIWTRWFCDFSSGRRVPEGESLVFQILADSGGGNYGRFFKILAGSGRGNYGVYYYYYFFKFFWANLGHAGFAHFSSGSGG